MPGIVRAAHLAAYRDAPKKRWRRVRHGRVRDRTRSTIRPSTPRDGIRVASPESRPRHAVACIWHVTSENKKPVNGPGRAGQVVNPVEASRNRNTLRRPRAKASDHVGERCRMVPFGKVSELI